MLHAWLRCAEARWAARRTAQLLALCLFTGAGGSRAAAPEDACVLSVRITPRHDSVPRGLAIELSFPAQGRTETHLRLQAGWAGISDAAAALNGWLGAEEGTRVSTTELPNRWRVTHPPGNTVRVRYFAKADLADPEDGRPQDQSRLYRTQVGATWFQFFGYNVLPSVESWPDQQAVRTCVTVEQPGVPDAPVFGSFLFGRGAVVRTVVDAAPQRMRDAFYAGGSGWRLTEQSLPSGTVYTAMRGKFVVDDGEFAQRVASLVDAHRRFWGEAQSPRQGVVLTPNFAPRNAGGTVVHQTAVLHAGPDFSPASASFESLIGHENLHQWFPGRFGSRAGDEVADVAHYWFSEGFTNYYAHRLLLSVGVWDLSRYALELTKTLQAYWRSPAREVPVSVIAPKFFSDRDAGQQLYSRGEILAMRWDRAMRAQGDAGLDDALRQLLLPSTHPEGVGPLATTRVLDHLQSTLGSMPRRDVAAHVDAGVSFDLDEALAGPCLKVSWQRVPRWSLGFDANSIASRKLTGVIPGGPADRAGIREGDELLGWSIYRGDVTREIELTVRTPDGTREVRYLPHAGSTDSLPAVHVRPEAATDSECLAWLRSS